MYYEYFTQIVSSRIRPDFLLPESAQPRHFIENMKIGSVKFYLFLFDFFGIFLSILHKIPNNIPVNHIKSNNCIMFM